MGSEDSQRVEPYDQPVQERERLDIGPTYLYEHPFNYPNIEVDRSFPGGEEHGLELMPVPEIQGNDPADRIILSEDEAIVRVVVIGSACTAPGWVALEADPIEEYPTNVDPPDTEKQLPVRFRETDLWGQHLRGDSHIDKEGTYREHPHTGMSCATFEIPRSTSVEIFAGSEVPGWRNDNYPDDFHYSIRQIRTTVVSE